MPADTEAACTGGCGDSSPDHDLCDMMGVGNDAHRSASATTAKYKRRAGVLAGAQEFVEAERIKRENGGREADTPRKPAKRGRIETDP
eukprot:g6538.t1